MPTGWSDFVSKVNKGQVTKENSEEMIGAWHQEVDDICLKLERTSNLPGVKLAKHRYKLTRKQREDLALKHLKENQYFDTAIKMPHLPSSIKIIADFKGKYFELTITCEAPDDATTPKKAFAWLHKSIIKSKKLNSDSDEFNGKIVNNLFLSIGWLHLKDRCNRSDMKEFLNKNYDLLIPDEFKKKRIKSFNIHYIFNVGKDFKKGKNFITHLESAVTDFYINVCQYVKDWVPPPIVKNIASEPVNDSTSDSEVVPIINTDTP